MSYTTRTDTSLGLAGNTAPGVPPLNASRHLPRLCPAYVRALENYLAATITPDHSEIITRLNVYALMKLEVLNLAFLR